MEFGSDWELGRDWHGAGTIWRAPAGPGTCETSWERETWKEASGPSTSCLAWSAGVPPALTGAWVSASDSATLRVP